MAASSDTQSFYVYVSNIESEGPFLTIYGQTDRDLVRMLDNTISTYANELDTGAGAASAHHLVEGLLCLAKYKDGCYYRVKITKNSGNSTGLIGVNFIDFGSNDVISLSTIRLLDGFNPSIMKMPPQATKYYIGGVTSRGSQWEKEIISKFLSTMYFAEYQFTMLAQVNYVNIVSIQFQGTTLSQYLIQHGYGQEVSINKQAEAIYILNSATIVPARAQPTRQPSFVQEPPYSELVQFANNSNFPSNPASAMRLQQMMPPVPFNGAYIQPQVQSVNQRLLAHRAPKVVQSVRIPNLPNPIEQKPKQIVNMMTVPPPQVNYKPPFPTNKITTYQVKYLDVNSEHKVVVSFSDDGPEQFAVQLVSDGELLNNLMEDINKKSYEGLCKNITPGTLCLGRMTSENVLSRAVVVDVLKDGCKIFFVDFGDQERVTYYDIYEIPEKYIKYNMFATKFALSGVKNLKCTQQVIDRFKSIVDGKVLTLKVVTPEGPPLVQYGRLYLDNESILDMLLSNKSVDHFQFTYLNLLPIGYKASVLVSYVDNCMKFYIQLTERIDELNNVMELVKIHCENTVAPGPMPVGAACCARFPDDGIWYRASVIQPKGTKVVVSYVDYGNEQEVDIVDIRNITEDLVQLPAQAMKFALKGFEQKPVETKTSNQLEMLALEKTLTAHIVGILSDDIMLVTLIDDSVSPPLDIGRRMNQLSQPRINPENKVVTPVRKDAPESVISSPESEGRSGGFRREKSFKEERWPKDNASEEFGQRGGSFRSRDNRDREEYHAEKAERSAGFDRSGSARTFNKFVPNNRQDRGDRDRPERGERRGGGRPWENKDSNTESHEQFDSRPNKDRSKTKSEHQSTTQDNWKPKSENAKRRNDTSSNKAGSVQDRLKAAGSVQDRLKRFNDNKSNNEWEENTGEQRNKYERRDNRSERSDNRKDSWGEKRDNRDFRSDNWSDRKDNAGGNRDFRSDRSDRGGRSNFSYRDKSDRDERSSNRSFCSDGNRSNYKPRSKFTQVQYKELASPVPLDQAFAEPEIEANSQQEVSVTWIISPESFYTQIMSEQPKFLDMMQKIPELYRGVKPYAGIIVEGSSVLARYPEDGVLYRAIVISCQPLGKYIVQYVDFGNKFLVDLRDIWQLEQELMELPKMAVHCSLLGVSPKEGEWKANNDIDLCFNAPRYQCIFHDFVDSKHKVALWNNGISVADKLIEKELAVNSKEISSIALKDEAIDLTIIVEQQINCQVTHVESFEKFYVHLDIDKAALVEAAMDGYDKALLKPLAEENLSDGVHCIFIDGDKVYRAILTDVSDTTSIKAVLPDYGRSVDATLDKLMFLPSELSVYFYQSLECRLNNYTADSHALLTLDELKKKLTGNKFIAYINSVDGITLVTTLYDRVSGDKISIFEPDEGAYEHVTVLCAHAVLNYNLGGAYVVHADSLDQVFLQRDANGVAIAALLDDLFNFYSEGGTAQPMESYEVSAMCAANSSDGNWYRAIIVSSTDADCIVQFVDYGNTETLPLESIKKLDSKFYQPCALALEVGLGLVALQDEALPTLLEWTKDKVVEVTLSFGSYGWLANLHLDGVDLSIKLVTDKFAAPQASPAEETKEADALAVEPLSLPTGCTQVYITHIDTPGQFWIQMVDKVDQLTEIQTELQENGEKYESVELREMGTLCVAKYLADDQWYRAEILDSDADITTVRFIDYGNTDVLDNEPSLLKAIPEHLKDIERFAVKASVNAIPTGTGQWSEPASDSFVTLVGDMSQAVDALVVLKDVTTYVDLFVLGQNITDKLVAEGHATRSENSSLGNLPSCYASHVNSPSEFWIQLETATLELQEVENAMVDAENFPELAEKEEGVLCAAKYPEDGAWYRAQVIVDGSEGTEVLFMDYGNASMATELRSLPEELKSRPALSRKCALQKPRDIKTWSRKSEEKFNELAAEGATIFNVQFIAAGDISIVELFHEGNSITEELVSLCEKVGQSERPEPVGQDMQVNCTISHITSAEEFYIQLNEKSSVLESIAEKLINGETFDEVEELKVGSLCAAWCAESEKWYRAKVLEACETGFHVQYIDNGKKSKCEKLRRLPEDLQTDPLAKCCQLAELNSSMPNDAFKTTLHKITSDNPTFQIEFLDTTREPNLVRLLLKGEDISTVLINSATFDNVQTRKELKDDVETVDEQNELNTSQPDLNESLESGNTVIENQLCDSDIEDKVEDKDDAAKPEEDGSEVKNDTLESSGDTLTPRDESKESIVADISHEESTEPAIVDSSPDEKEPIEDKCNESHEKTNAFETPSPKEDEGLAAENCDIIPAAVEEKESTAESNTTAGTDESEVVNEKDPIVAVEAEWTDDKSTAQINTIAADETKVTKDKDSTPAAEDCTDDKSTAQINTIAADETKVTKDKDSTPAAEDCMDNKSTAQINTIAADETKVTKDKDSKPAAEDCTDQNTTVDSEESKLTNDRDATIT